VADLKRLLSQGLGHSTSASPPVKVLQLRIAFRRRRRFAAVSTASVSVLAVCLVALIAFVHHGGASNTHLNVVTGPPPSSAISTTTTTPSSGAVVFQPDGIGFWTSERGLLVGTMTTPACLSGYQTCPGGVIERTVDGGDTWQVVDQVSGPLNAIAISGTDVAWVTVARCGAASSDACAASGLMRTSDGGSTWTDVLPSASVTSVSPVSASTAWAVASTGSPTSTTGTGLVRTDDG